MNWQKIIISFFVFALPGIFPAEAQTEKQPLVESGMIQYVFSGDFAGKETVYFDHYGAQENHLKILTSLSKNENTKSRIIINNEKKLETNLTTGKYSVSNNNSFNKNGFVNETKQILQAGHFKKSGTETIAGKVCDKYLGNMGTLYVWRGIILKSEIDVAGKQLIKTAVLVDTLSPVPKEKFIIKQ